MVTAIMIKVAELMVPIEKAMSFFKKPEALINQYDVNAVRAHIQDGDFLFERCDWMLSNWFIPGPYKHIALYWNDMVYEAVTTGVRAITLEEWLFKKDHVAIGRQAFFEPTESAMLRGQKFLLKHAYSREKYQYDFIIPSTIRRPFSKRWHAWFCSEFVYGWCMACCPDFDHRCPLPRVMGQMKMTPDDFWNRIIPVMTIN